MSLDGLRLRQNERLADRCRITRGSYPDQTTVASNVPCLVRPSKDSQREVEVAGGELVGIPSYAVRLAASVDVRRDDVVEVTTSQRDPGFASRYLIVVAVQADSYSTTRVAVCRETQQ